MTHAYTARIWKEPSPPPHTVYPPPATLPPARTGCALRENRATQPEPLTSTTAEVAAGGKDSAKKRVSFKADDSLVKIFEIPNVPRCPAASATCFRYDGSGHVEEGVRRRLISCQTIDARIIDLKTALPGSTLQQRYRLLQQGGVRIMSHFRRLNIINQAASQQRYKVTVGKNASEKRKYSLSMTNEQLLKKPSPAPSSAAAPSPPSPPPPRITSEPDNRLHPAEVDALPLNHAPIPYIVDAPSKRRSIMSAPCVSTTSLNGPVNKQGQEVREGPLCLGTALERYSLRDALRIRAADRAALVGTGTHKGHTTTSTSEGHALRTMSSSAAYQGGVSSRQRNPAPPCSSSSSPSTRHGGDLLPKIQISAYQSRHIADPSSRYTMHPSRRISKLLAW